MDLNSPIFQIFWGMVLAAVAGATATVKNPASAKKIIAMLQHGIEVLTEAVVALQAQFPK